jgi:hypothetical protein
MSIFLIVAEIDTDYYEMEMISQKLNKYFRQNLLADVSALNVMLQVAPGKVQTVARYETEEAEHAEGKRA